MPVQVAEVTLNHCPRFFDINAHIQAA